jgi:hypothetical protein
MLLSWKCIQKKLSGNLLLPVYDNYKKTIELIFIIPMLLEVALGLWLLIKGVNVQQLNNISK